MLNTCIRQGALDEGGCTTEEASHVMSRENTSMQNAFFSVDLFVYSPEEGGILRCMLMVSSSPPIPTNQVFLCPNARK